MSNRTRNPPWSRDESILGLDLYLKCAPSLPTEDDARVIELSTFLNKLPIHSAEMRGQNFRNPTGVAFKLANFLHIDPTDNRKGFSGGSRTDAAVWRDFHDKPELLARIVSAIREFTESHEAKRISEISDDSEAEEGQVLSRTHLLRERNRPLIRKKKKSFVNKYGRLFCEVCSFDFNVTYGPRGKTFIECHHLTPLADLRPATKTKLSDLVLLCANCHRIVHVSRPWLSIAQLRTLITSSYR
jgi:5-methylcytosine-specific restriction protein A